MKAHCLPFSQIPHTTRLFTDYLSYSSKVRQFYPRTPNLSDWVTTENPGARYSANRRQQVSAILERQNRSWQASSATLANLERLRKGASVVVTGQQVGLFGGPAFALYKALTAIKLAAEATAAGVESVPVFWLATNDHDLAEVNHVWLAGLDGVPELITTGSQGTRDAAVGTIRLGPEIEGPVQRAAELLGDSSVAEFLRAAYRPEETLGGAFARLMSALLGDFGVILLDPNDPGLSVIAEPIYRAAIEDSAELDDALLKRGKELEDAGYHQQVKVTSSSTLQFALKNGSRTPIHRRPNGNSFEFSIGDEKLSHEQLLRWIGSHPQEFSPNVLLRPVVEDYLLPTLAYTGGAAEIAYFAQVGVVYEALLGHTTPILPRFSATLIESKEQRLLEKYKLQAADVFQGPEKLEEKLAGRTLPEELQRTFDHAGSSLERSLKELDQALGRLDPTLNQAAARSGSKMRYQLNRLRSRAARAQARHSEVVARHADQLSHGLFPHKVLQEREIGGVSYVARHGGELLQGLYGMIHTDCHDHQVVVLD